MPELTDLRALLRDRQLKDGALGTCESTLCLDAETVDELNALEEERGEMIKAHQQLYPKDDKRMAGPVELPLDTTEMDARVEAAKQRVRETTVVITFQALSSMRYQEILAEHPDANSGDLDAFLVDLAAACFRDCKMLDGTKMDIPWAELRDAITYGEWEPISIQVLGINRRKVDVPFSLKPSKKTR